MTSSNLPSQFINNPRIMMVQKDHKLQYLDCNNTWLHYAGLKNKDHALGLTDKDMIWGFVDILEAYENNILKGQAYPLINPAFVEDNRFCWLQNYKWPRYDEKKNIIGLNVIAYEIENVAIVSALSLFAQKNKFGVKSFSINQPLEDNLSVKEKETLFYFCHGMAIKKIAQLMKISTRTVEAHLNHIKFKLICTSRSQIIEYAVNKGYISILPHHSLISNLININSD